MRFNENLYLDSLTLKNFATFTDQTIKFSTELNAIVGETGSGKSLILDALQLILGQRADKKLVRKDAEFTLIQAIFQCKDESIKKFFDEQGYPFDDNEIIIKRIIYANGKSKSYVNYQLCNLSILNQFAKRFIDLVGQFENQKLLSETYQLLLLDNFANNNSIKNSFTLNYNKLQNLKLKLENLKKTKLAMTQKLEFLKYQLNEINELNPSEEDELELTNKKNFISNQEKIKHVSSEVQLLIHGNDHNDGLLNQLRHLSKIVSSQREFVKVENIEQLDDMYNFLSELDHSFQLDANIDINESEIQFVIERLDLYQSIKRKYSKNTNELIDFAKSLEVEIRELENYELTLGALEDEIASAQELTYTQAHTLHQTRVEAAIQLSTSLTNEINKLKMDGASIEIQVKEELQLGANGFSRVNFIAETNLGEGFFKVKDIASGGELSRILLALRQVVSTQDSISIFLFDEIDSGIGGETALCIGKALQEVSNKSQVIAITHLPQIATFAKKLILVDKNYDEATQRTISTVQEISGNRTKLEVKKMIGLIQD